MAKLFIVGFPKEMEEIELVEMFSFCGTVNTVTIVTDKDTGQSKGYGFITMSDQEGADRAILAMDGTEIGKRTISVRIAEEKKPSKQEPDKALARKPSFTARKQEPEVTRKKRPRQRI